MFSKNKSEEIKKYLIYRNFLFEVEGELSEILDNINEVVKAADAQLYTVISKTESSG